MRPRHAAALAACLIAASAAHAAAAPAAVAPAASGLRIVSLDGHHHALVALLRPARVRVTLRRGASTVIRTPVRPLPAGSLDLDLGPLRPGRYALAMELRGGSGGPVRVVARFPVAGPPAAAGGGGGGSMVRLAS